ncbi:MAG: hypothetical protein JWO22_1872 [Frankiales bacterium]|nr:hypothetical protein [Frankiales bacterium]
MKAFKAVSDALLALAVVFAVVALFGHTWAWYVAAFCLLDSIVAARFRRRAAKAAKAAGSAAP